jgi:hypothetical protein
MTEIGKTVWQTARWYTFILRKELGIWVSTLFNALHLSIYRKYAKVFWQEFCVSGLAFNSIALLFVLKIKGNGMYCTMTITVSTYLTFTFLCRQSKAIRGEKYLFLSCLMVPTKQNITEPYSQHDCIQFLRAIHALICRLLNGDCYM